VQQLDVFKNGHARGTTNIPIHKVNGEIQEATVEKNIKKDKGERAYTSGKKIERELVT